MFIIPLGSNKGETVQLKQNFEFGRPYNEMGPTNHSTHTGTHTNWETRPIDTKILQEKLDKSDQYQYLGNCPPTPPRTQQQSIDNKSGLMLG